MMPVNSHNEWDTLEEVIVGNGFPSDLPIQDYSFKVFFHDNIYGQPVWEEAGHKFITSRHIEEHSEDIENFVSILKSLNITVVRPKVPKNVKTTKTLCWNSTNYPALNVRDLSIIVGNEIIETPVQTRWRQFENDYLKHVFLDYFKRGAKWTAAPRPLVLDNSFDMSRIYQTSGAEGYYNSIKSKFKNDLDCGVEIMFDGANCMRLGDVILFNAPTDHERLGAKWLRQHLGDKYKIWEVDISDGHIDSVFLPLRPGLALITLKEVADNLPEPLKKWDLIYIPVLDRADTHMRKQSIAIASPKIWLNVLSTSPDRIICHTEYHDALSSALKKYKIDVVPSQIRHCEIFGGAHHCMTLDVKRKSKLENYF